jgi:outer membrane receptor protein involved in Fe transport
MDRWMALLTALFLIGSVQVSTAQSSASGDGRVTGRIVTADGEASLAGVTVAVRRQADSTRVGGTVTDSTGTFVVDNLSYGVYTLRLSFVGYATKRLTDIRLVRSRPERALGTITMTRTTEELDEVTVSAERPVMEVQTDRTVYNTGQQIVTAGGSAREVLNDLPSIRVDLDGGISYRGNEGVVVHINGEPTSLSGQSLASFLQSLPAAAIQRVEVIPNPSAAEEPEGAAGIINIILKRNRGAGWSGGVTAGGGMNSTYDPAVNASANAGYQSSGWRFFATYGFRGDADRESGSRFRRNLTTDPATLLDEADTEREEDRSHTVNAQAEYRPSDATSLSVETVFSTEAETQEGRTDYLLETPGGQQLDHYARVADETSGERSLDGRLSFNHDFSNDHALDVQLRYERELEDEDALYTERLLMADETLSDVRERERNRVTETEQEGTLEIDYVRPLGDVTLEAGYQGELRTQRSDQTAEVSPSGAGAFQVDASSFFDYQDQTHALYSQATVPISEALEAKAGLRAEQTFRAFTVAAVDETFNNPYFNLFPSAFLTYSPSEAYQARLSYSKRIRRPGTWQLDPVDDNQNPTFRRVGNPRLDPEYIHSFELSMTRKWDPVTLSVTPFFRRTVNEIERRETLRSDGVTELTYENFASSNSYGLEVVTSLQLEDWVRGNVALNANRVVTDASNIDTDLSNNAIAYSGRLNLTFPLSYGIDLQVSQYYRAPMDIPGGRISGRTSSDVALQKDLFGGDGSLSLRASDVFDAMNFNVQRETDSFVTRSTRDWSQRELMVTFSYSFGGEAGDQRGGRDRDYR